MITFPLYDPDGSPLPGQAPIFAAYVDAAGAPKSAPTVEDLGGGMYGFTADPDRAYLVDCGEEASPRYLSGGTGGLVAFGLFDDEGEPWEGFAPAFAAYVGTAPSILALAPGLFGFVPSVADRIAGASYLVAAPEGAAPAHYSGTVPAISGPAAVGPTMVLGGPGARGTQTIKTGDLLPALLIQIVDAEGSPVDLTGRGVHVVVSATPGSSPQVDRAATVTDANAGMCRLDWEPGDTDRPGILYVEAVVTDADGRPMTLPGSGRGIVLVERRLRP